MSNPYLNAAQFGTYDGFESRQAYRRGRSSYRFCAARLLERMQEPKGSALVYDIGCGTGNSTIEVLSRWNNARVVGIDNSKGMLAYARLKFGLSEESHLIDNLVSAGEMQLAIFLMLFRYEATNYSANVRFILADFMNFGAGQPLADAIVGSQVLHWLEPQETAAENFAALLRSGGQLGLGSAMNFYNPRQIRAEKFNSLCYDFVQYYLDLLAEKIARATCQPVAPWERNINTKKDPEETIALFESKGFVLKRYHECLLPQLDADVVLDYYLQVMPEHIGMFATFPKEESYQALAKVLIKEALAEAVSKYGHLLPPEGIRTDSLAMFIFQKQGS